MMAWWRDWKILRSLRLPQDDSCTFGVTSYGNVVTQSGTVRLSDRRICQREGNTRAVELAQRVKLRGFGTFVIVRHWKILQSLRLLQDDIRGFNALDPQNLNDIRVKRPAGDRLRPFGSHQAGLISVRRKEKSVVTRSPFASSVSGFTVASQVMSTSIRFNAWRNVASDL